MSWWKGDARRPAQPGLRLGCVRDEEIDFGRAHVPLILHDVVTVVEVDAGKGALTQLLHGPRLAGPDDVVFGRWLLQHLPHGGNVIAGESPIAPRVEGTEAELAGLPELNARRAVGDLRVTNSRPRRSDS